MFQVKSLSFNLKLTQSNLVGNMNLNFSPVMRIQNTTLNFSNNRNPQQICKELLHRNDPKIFTQLNLSNNDFILAQFPIIPSNFQVLILNNCKIQSLFTIRGIKHARDQKQNKMMMHSIKATNKYNESSEIPNHVRSNDLTLLSLVQLQLKGNNICDIDFMGPQNSKNAFKSHNCFQRKLKMKSSFGFAVSLQDQKVQQIFILPSLRKLNLNENKIKQISSRIRKMFPSLILLSIMKNEIQKISYDLIYDCFMSQRLSPKLNKSVHMHSKKLSCGSISNFSPMTKLKINHQVLNQIDFELYIAFAKQSVVKDENQQSYQQFDFNQEQGETQQSLKMDKIPQQRTQSEILASQSDFYEHKFDQQQDMIQIRQLLKQYISIVEQFGSQKTKFSRISVVARKSKQQNNTIQSQILNLNSTISSLNDSCLTKSKNKQKKTVIKLTKLYQSIIQNQNISSLETIIDRAVEKTFTSKQKLRNNTLQEILQLSVRNQKISCVQLIIQKLQLIQGFVQQRIATMNPSLFMLPQTSIINRNLANQITAEAILQVISNKLDLMKHSSKNKDTQIQKINQFLTFLRINKISLIKSEQHCAALIRDYSFGPGLTYLFENQIEVFFTNRKYGHPLQDPIVKQILAIDSPSLLFKFLKIKDFYKSIIHNQNYRKIVKPNWRIYRLLIKEHKKHIQQAKDTNKCFHFPQYLSFSKRQFQFQTLLVRNDLYDYNCTLLKDYQRMQRSYQLNEQVPLRSSIKVISRDRCYSVAKKIDSRLKNSASIMQSCLKTTKNDKQNKKQTTNTQNKFINKSLQIQDILSISKKHQPQFEQVKKHLKSVKLSSSIFCNIKVMNERSFQFRKNIKR